MKGLYGQHRVKGALIHEEEALNQCVDIIVRVMVAGSVREECSSPQMQPMRLASPSLTAAGFLFCLFFFRWGEWLTLKQVKFIKTSSVSTLAIHFLDWCFTVCDHTRLAYLLICSIFMLGFYSVWVNKERKYFWHFPLKIFKSVFFYIVCQWAIFILQTYSRKKLFLKQFGLTNMEVFFKPTPFQMSK